MEQAQTRDFIDYGFEPVHQAGCRVGGLPAVERG